MDTQGEVLSLNLNGALKTKSSVPKLNPQQMTVLDWMRESASFGVYPNVGGNMRYPIVGLIGELGELMEQAKKLLRVDSDYPKRVAEFLELRVSMGSPFEFNSKYNAAIHERFMELMGDRKQTIIKELGDVLWYVNQLCFELAMVVARATEERGIAPLFAQVLISQARYVERGEASNVLETKLTDLGSDWAGKAPKLMLTNNALLYFLPMPDDNGIGSMFAFKMLSLHADGVLQRLAHHTLIHGDQVTGAAHMEDLLSLIKSVVELVFEVGAHLMVTPGEIMIENYKKLSARREQGLIKGDGSDR